MQHLQIIDGCYCTVEQISNFTIKLSRTEQTKTGEIRHVRLKKANESQFGKEIILPSLALTTPSSFRTWLLDQGHYFFSGGQMELHKLIQDFNTETK